MSKSSTNLTYLHKVMTQTLTDGVVITHEEQIVDGPKGVSIKYFSKDKSGQEKISIYFKNGEYIMKVDMNGEKSEKKLSKSEVLEELKKNKKLKFAADFAKTQKGGAWLNSNKKPKMASKNASAKSKSKSKSKSKQASAKRPVVKKVKKAKKAKVGTK